MKLTENFFDTDWGVSQYSIKYIKENQTLKSKIVIVPLPKGRKFFIYMDNDEVIAYQDEHIFTAFSSLRQQLENKSKVLLCVGSRTDVYPSGKQFSSETAFHLTLNKRVEPEKDLVNLFDEELDLTKIGTVQQQKNFYQEWLKSIKKII